MRLHVGGAGYAVCIQTCLVSLHDLVRSEVAGPGCWSERRCGGRTVSLEGGELIWAAELHGAQRQQN